VLRLVSWNMAYRRAAWAGLDGLRADVALVQEAGAPGPEWALKVVPDAAAGWETALPGGRPKWRTEHRSRLVFAQVSGLGRVPVTASEAA